MWGAFAYWVNSTTVNVQIIMVVTGLLQLLFVFSLLDSKVEFFALLLMCCLFCIIGHEIEYFTLVFYHCNVLVEITSCMLYKDGKVDYFNYYEANELFSTRFA